MCSDTLDETVRRLYGHILGLRIDLAKQSKMSAIGPCKWESRAHQFILPSKRQQAWFQALKKALEDSPAFVQDNETIPKPGAWDFNRLFSLYFL